MALLLPRRDQTAAAIWATLRPIPRHNVGQRCADSTHRTYEDGECRSLKFVGFRRPCLRPLAADRPARWHVMSFPLAARSRLGQAIPKVEKRWARGTLLMVWTNAPLVVYHGTDDNAARDIVQNGIRLDLCGPAADFGRGFYITTNLHQARQWANKRALSTGGKAAVVIFRLDRDKVAELDDHLTFVVPSDEFYDFVRYNRIMGNTDHARSGAAPYDVIYGPVTAYPQQLVYLQCDQICLLNQKAIDCLLDRPPPSVDYADPYFPP